MEERTKTVRGPVLRNEYAWNYRGGVKRGRKVRCRAGWLNFFSFRGRFRVGGHWCVNSDVIVVFRLT